MKLCTLLCLALSSTDLVCFGGPLQRSDIPASPAWLAHVNWDALRTSAVGQYIQDQLNQPEAQAKLAVLQSVVSIDLRTQLHGTTLYSTDTAPEDAVLIIYADFDPERLVTLAKAANNSQHSAYKTHTIYNWIDDKKHKSKAGVKPRVYAAVDGARVIFGQKEERVAQALDVSDGASPNLSSNDLFPQFGAAGDPSFLEAAALKFQISDSTPNAAMLRLSKQVTLQIAQPQQQVSATLTLEANDEQVAGLISSIGQGLIALAKLQTNNPEAVRFADALSLKQDGARIIATAAIPSQELIGMMKADAARKADRKAQRSAGTATN